MIDLDSLISALIVEKVRLDILREKYSEIESFTFQDFCVGIGSGTLPENFQITNEGQSIYSKSVNIEKLARDGNILSYIRDYYSVRGDDKKVYSLSIRALNSKYGTDGLAFTTLQRAFGLTLSYRKDTAMAFNGQYPTVDLKSRKHFNFSDFIFGETFIKSTATSEKAVKYFKEQILQKLEAEVSFDNLIDNWISKKGLTYFIKKAEEENILMITI